jgi:hypothetical protein
VKALIACDGNGNGCVLEYCEGLRWYIEETCPSTLGDVGFDDAPRGLTIWEGALVGGAYQPYQGDYDDVVPEGKFRPLTEAEWQAMMEGKRVIPIEEGESL